MLYTLDCDDFILENAEISESFDDGETEMEQNNANPDALKIVGWKRGDFGDCWVKFYKEPEIDENGRTEIDGVLCKVLTPGAHPGGRAWWCSPVDPVFVPVYENTVEDD